MKILKFSTPTCGQCRMIDQYFQKEGVVFEEIDCTSDVGSLRAGYYEINHVPCVIIAEDDGTERQRFCNLPAILKALKAGEFNFNSNHSGEHNAADGSGLIDFQ